MNKSCKEPFYYPGVLWKYDAGIFLEIKVEIPEEEFVHFQSVVTGKVYSLAPEGKKVQIPNQILAEGEGFKVYAYTTKNEYAKTLAMSRFEIKARPKPPEYIYDPTPVITYPELITLIEDMKQLNKMWSNPEATIEELPAGSPPSVLAHFNEEGVQFDFRLPRSTSASTYIYQQQTASDTWVISHDLRKYPSVTVVDSAGSQVIGDVNYVDMNNLIIKFNGIFSGKAYLN